MALRGTLLGVVAVFACVAAPAAFAQSADGTRITGTYNAALPDGGFAQTSFTCAGESPCAGTYQGAVRDEGCSNTFSLVGSVVVTGLSAGPPGPIQGTIVLSNIDFEDEINPDGTCSIKPGTFKPSNMPFTGTWNGTTGSFVSNVTDNLNRPFQFIGSYTVELSVPAPVFPMVVTGSVDGKVANIRADIQYRPQDVGTTGSVYVFAVAPASLVQGATGPSPMHIGTAEMGGSKADPVACVLAQLNASGQLVGVTAATLQAYVSGVLSAQGQSVAVLNGVSTGNIAGSTFYVGYGTSGTAMINNGINRSAVTVTGTAQCRPQPPQTGWWWNPLEDGRGFSIEVRGNNLFFASFLYDVSGRSTWYVSSGPVSLDGSLYNGDLLSARGGQTLGGAYPGFPAVVNEGRLTLAFNDASRGTLAWPGGTVPIQRFNIVPDGLAIAVAAGLPESGWWWNEQESGRGFFMEWQNGILDLAGYMYDDAGNPVWYITVGGMVANGTAQFQGSWWSYAGGQSLTGAWKPNRQVSNSVAPVTLTFSNRETAVITLPNGRTSTLRRHRF